MKKYIVKIIPFILLFVALFSLNIYAATGEVDNSSVYCDGQLSLEDNLVYKITYTKNDRWGTTETIECSTPVQNINVCLYVEELGTNRYTLKVINGDWIPGQILHYSGLFGGIDPMTYTGQHFLYVTPYPYSDYSEYMPYACSFETNIPIFENETAARSWIAGVNGIESAINYNKTYSFADGTAAWNAVAVSGGSSGGSNGSFIYNEIYEKLEEETEASDANSIIQNETLTDEVVAPSSMLDILKSFSTIMENTNKYIKSLYYWVLHSIDNFFNNFVPNVIEKNFGIVVDAIEGLVDSFLEMLQNFFDWMYTHEFIDGLSIKSIFEFFRNIAQDILSAIQGITTGEITFPELMEIILPERLTELTNGFYNLGYDGAEFSLSLMFQNLLLPRDNYLENKIDTVVLSKFGFIETGYAFIDSIKSALNQTENVMPVITTDTYEWKGIVIPSYTISFEWYEKLKLYVDPIVSAFCWITFVYHTIVNLPSLLRGGSVLGHYAFEVDVSPLPDEYGSGPILDRLPDNSGFSMNGRRMK